MAAGPRTGDRIRRRFGVLLHQLGFSVQRLRKQSARAAQRERRYPTAMFVDRLAKNRGEPRLAMPMHATD